MKFKLLYWLNDFWYLYVRTPFSILSDIISRLYWCFGVKDKALKHSLASFRYGKRSGSIAYLRKIIASGAGLHKSVSHGVGIGEAAVRSIIIKWPSYTDNGVEKGIIVITFTKTFSYFLRNINVEQMSEHFIFVLEPSWSGYADPDILGFIGRVKGVVVQASEIEDRVFLNSFPDTFIPVSFGASDWVDTNVFRKTDSPKKYDSIYITNANPIKRIKRYLDALKHIVESGDSGYVGCLVCAGWGGSEQLVTAMVASYQLERNVELKFSLTRAQVIEHLNESKVNILLSYKEGSNRSLFESMFCDVPVLCLSENIGVNKSYINEYTGTLIADSDLEASLQWMKSNYLRFSPRDWAMANISPQVTTKKLLQVINTRLNVSKKLELSELLVKTNNPEVSYMDFPEVGHQDFTRQVLELSSVGAELEFAEYAKKINEISARVMNKLNVPSFNSQ